MPYTTRSGWVMALNAMPLIVTAKLADQAYELLLRDISTGFYAPGHPLRELELVVRLGISRTPVREALVRLTATGLVTVRGRRMFVRRLTVGDVVQVYHVRRGLEGEAARLACGRLTAADFARLDALAPDEADVGTPGFEEATFQFDRALHRTIAERSGCPMLAAEIAKYHDLIKLMHTLIADRTPVLVRELREHRAIVAALRAGDRRAARRVLLTHLRSVCRSHVRYLTAALSPTAPRRAAAS